MDNLPVHRAAAVREVIEAAGAKLRYHPKYSPDLNPIEQAFSKLKARLRLPSDYSAPLAQNRNACGRIQPAMHQLLPTCRICV